MALGGAVEDDAHEHNDETYNDASGYMEVDVRVRGFGSFLK